MPRPAGFRRFFARCLPPVAVGLVALGLVVSCATTGKYEEILNGWVGREGKELVDTWGVPSRTHVLSDGKKMYEYKFRDRHGEKTERRGPAGGEIGCRTYFIADPSDVILSWKWEGHDCVAK